MSTGSKLATAISGLDEHTLLHGLQIALLQAELANVADRLARHLDGLCLGSGSGAFDFSSNIRELRRAELQRAIAALQAERDSALSALRQERDRKAPAAGDTPHPLDDIPARLARAEAQFEALTGALTRLERNVQSRAPAPARGGGDSPSVTDLLKRLLAAEADIHRLDDALQSKEASFSGLKARFGQLSDSLDSMRRASRNGRRSSTGSHITEEHRSDYNAATGRLFPALSCCARWKRSGITK
jgi:chromosome segregation ATPase